MKFGLEENKSNMKELADEFPVIQELIDFLLSQFDSMDNTISV